MNRNLLILAAASTAVCVSGDMVMAASDSVSDDVIAKQRAILEKATADAGFGPQSPRDIDAKAGSNTRVFGAAPAHTTMNLCNIHFHENAEHKGGEFTTYAGNGDGHGYGTGFKYVGELTEAELLPVDMKIGENEHGDLVPGDTIEVHFVHSTAQITPGPSLGSCISEAINNPQLRVETQVIVLVNDESALDFGHMASVEMIDGLYQAPNIPTDMGTPIIYAGSTTGPGYNEKGSPFQVTWSIRPQVAKVNIASVGGWLSDNVFDEDYAHGVRNLVLNDQLLSPISN